mmetsp:Transcript_13526/g.32026  ORF Transcript_13526/g.32026 Transcript_13526/m.32026 type:complete len:233 (-) Transcript_13526:505-1203(-)
MSPMNASPTSAKHRAIPLAVSSSSQSHFSRPSGGLSFRALAAAAANLGRSAKTLETSSWTSGTIPPISLGGWMSGSTHAQTSSHTASAAASKLSVDSRLWRESTTSGCCTSCEPSMPSPPLSRSHAAKASRTCCTRDSSASAPGTHLESISMALGAQARSSSMYSRRRSGRIASLYEPASWGMTVSISSRHLRPSLFDCPWVKRSANQWVSPPGPQLVAGIWGGMAASAKQS